MSNKLFVGGLSWGTTDQALHDYFAQAGTVTSAVVIKDKFSGRSKGFGFVEMSSPEEAQSAIQQFNGQTFDGRAIIVNEARPQVPKDNRGGRSSGGYNKGRSYDDRGGRDW